MAIPWNFTLNVNLQEGSAQQLDFLQEVANHPALSDEKVALRLCLSVPLSLRLCSPFVVDWAQSTS